MWPPAWTFPLGGRRPQKGRMRGQYARRLVGAHSVRPPSLPLGEVPPPRADGDIGPYGQQRTEIFVGAAACGRPV